MKEAVTYLTDRAARSGKAPKNPVKYIFRFALIGLFLYVILSRREVETLALLVGLSVIVIATTIASLKFIMNISENDTDAS